MLKFLPLFFASLRRKPIRTSLTIASIIEQQQRTFGSIEAVSELAGCELYFFCEHLLLAKSREADEESNRRVTGRRLDASN